MNAAQLAIAVKTDAARAATDLARVATEISDVGHKAAASSGDLGKARRSIEDVASSTDAMATKTGTATGALGALAGGLDAVGLGPYATALTGIATATDVASGASDLLTLALESSKVHAIAAKVQTVALTVATNAQAVAQRALNLVMRANPLGLVITAITLLVAGVVLAYKKSDTFRRICQTAFEKVAAAGRFMWNNVLRPVFSALLTAIAAVLDMWGKMLRALGHVPGFGWATKAGKALGRAADKVRELRDGINDVNRQKDPTINVRTPGLQKAVDLSRQLVNNLTNIPGLNFNNPLARTATSTSRVAVGASSGHHQVNITVQGAVDPVSTARQISTLLKRQGILLNGAY